MKLKMIKKIPNKIKEYFELIKFEHTIFALPFALSGMLLANPSGLPNIKTVFFVIFAMVGARTAGMALNRVIDCDIDKLNPRTTSRAIPAGRIKKSSAYFLTCLGFWALVYSSFQLPFICVKLLPMAILILVVYSFTKRFTNLSHFVLGAALGAGASGGWLAVTGSFNLSVVLWGLAVTFWVAGFDIIYSLQDLDFDRENNLFSIPATFGALKSLFISRWLHCLTLLLLLALGIIHKVDIFYWAGLLFMAFMLIYEHSLLKKEDLTRINIAFFNINGYISIGLFAFILVGKIF